MHKTLETIKKNKMDNVIIGASGVMGCSKIEWIFLSLKVGIFY